MTRTLMVLALGCALTGGMLAVYGQGLMTRLPGTVPPSDTPIVVNGDFEDPFAAPWGGRFDSLRPDVWRNYGQAQSRAEIDRRRFRRGAASLHLTNPPPSLPGAWGATQQIITVIPGQRYRVTLWAWAEKLERDGAVRIIMDEGTGSPRPVIQLEGGSYKWRPYAGAFVPDRAKTQLVIRIEGAGEAWIDDIVVLPESSPGPPVEVGPLAGAATAPSDPARSRMNNLGQAVAAFRQTGLRDYHRALAGYALDTVREKFRELDAELWSGINARGGWSFLLNTSVIAHAGSNDQPLVAFYNPWCDVFLVTAWDARHFEPRLLDAEILIGDWVRTRGKFPYNPRPAWLRGNENRPLALGVIAAASVRAFEQAFAAASAADWRSKLPGLTAWEVRVDLNYATAALLVASAIEQIDLFSSPRDGEDVRLAKLRIGTAFLLDRARRGRLERLSDIEKNSQIIPQKILSEIPAASLQTLAVAGFDIRRDESCVFLTPAFNADCCLALTYTSDPVDPRLTRVEVISFQGIYHRLYEKGK